MHGLFYSYVARIINSFTGNILTVRKLVTFKKFYLYHVIYFQLSLTTCG